jgi:hypothetical protein
MTHEPVPGADPGADPTIGRLVSDVTRDVSSLVRQEIQLAKSELKVSAKAGGLGIGFFGGAAFLGLLAVIMFSISIAFFIHWNGDGLGLHWAFLIVFGVYLAIAGVLGWLGLRKVKQVRAPERSIHQAQETRSAFKRH